MLDSDLVPELELSDPVCLVPELELAVPVCCALDSDLVPELELTVPVCVPEFELVPVLVSPRGMSKGETDPVPELVPVPEWLEIVCVVLESGLVPELELTVPVCVALD